MNNELKKEIEPAQRDEGQGSEAENTGAASENEKSDTLHAEQTPGSETADYADKAMGDEPPVDWFEPVEDFDGDAEEESLAGESERSFSIAGSETTSRMYIPSSVRRRSRANANEGWEEWPDLGEGWKRKEVIRRSGSSMGQKDVYYLSPRGDRIRSRVELISMLDGVLDMTTFDFKSGKFVEGTAPTPRVRKKRKIRERSSSESSYMERGEGADTPDSYYSVTPNIMNSKNIGASHSTYPNMLPGSPLDSPLDSPHDSPHGTPHSTPHNTSHGIATAANKRSGHGAAEDVIRLPYPSSSKPLRLPSIKGEFGSEENTLVCFKCGIPFTGTWYDKQRKKPCCPTCWASKSKEHPMIRYRKWLPCGQCVGCHNSINCGQCANCKHGLSSPEARKRVCRKRRCICPIHKAPSSVTFLQQKSQIDISENNDDTSMSFQSEFADEQHPSLKNSDTENLGYNVDVDDDDDMSTDDDDDWHKKRKRRSCGECAACRCRKDCGTCDFCVDKPKFGGCNKKRQKCRLRQCERQAMMGQGEYRPEGLSLPGRSKPYYTYSRKPNLKKNKPEGGFELPGHQDDDNDDDNSNMRWNSEAPSGRNENDLIMTHNLSLLEPISYANYGQTNGVQHKGPVPSNQENNVGLSNEQGQQSRWGGDRLPPGQKPIEEEDEELPVITRIFSWDDMAVSTGAESENELMKLLRSLRSSALPILWYAIMVEGPQLQLIQCSKQSVMSDTVVVIDPGFYFQIIVQKQPLLPTHSLYDSYPERLTNVTDVVNLLLGLEKYVVCQGLTPKETLPKKEPIILERAATCDFLVRKNATICVSCRTMQGL